MTAEPALLDLANLNIAHWQSDSDQRNILHVARVPILFAAGLGDSEAPIKKLNIGATTFINGQIGSDLKYVEHSGKGIEAGRQDLQDLEQRMAQMGLNMLVKGAGRSGSATATARVLDQSEADSPLSMFETVTPGAQELSMARRAASPLKLAPYPTLVGTAKTGEETSPPTTEGRAPSIPATTTTAAASRRRGTFWRTLWRPATPTS